MKYGTFIWVNNEEKKRTHPDLQNLPQRCCAKCEQWSKTDENPCIGSCFAHSCTNEDSDSEFSWADDICEEFQPKETVLHWENFPCVTKLICRNVYLLRKNSGDICVGEYYTEDGEEFFVVNGYYVEKYNFDRIAEIYKPRF